MSFASIVSSALVKPDPSTLIVGAVGSRIVPTINTVAVADSALLQPIAALTVPKGVWSLTGSIAYTCTTAGQSLNGAVAVALDAVVAIRLSDYNNQLNVATFGLSYTFVSDGTAVLTLPSTLNTSAGSTYFADAANELSVVVLTCIA